MATNDDGLDDFFKKKDRKGNKPKKQSTLLTNNEELHKQLVIVTSATTAFKENMDLEDDDDDYPLVDNTLVGTRNTDDSQTILNKNQSHNTKTKIPDNNHLNEQAINITGGQQQQQEGEWEEFEDPNSKYEQLRLKFSRGNNDNDNEDDDYYDDENNLITNDDNNDITGDREQQKDKPVWKLDQVKQTEITLPTVVEKIEEPPPPPQPKPSTGAYRPPQMRSGSSVTIVSGVTQKPSKKKEPNLASNEEFPTLGSTVNKK